jgi:hypothetical protein
MITQQEKQTLREYGFCECGNTLINDECSVCREKETNQKIKVLIPYLKDIDRAEDLKQLAYEVGYQGSVLKDKLKKGLTNLLLLSNYTKVQEFEQGIYHIFANKPLVDLSADENTISGVGEQENKLGCVSVGLLSATNKSGRGRGEDISLSSSSPNPSFILSELSEEEAEQDQISRVLSDMRKAGDLN